MTSLSNEQKQLLFDYCMGLTTGEEAAEVESLISSNKEAAHLHCKLVSALAPLESLEFEPCPDSLVESTIERLKMAHASRARLQQLLVTEQVQESPGRTRLWVELGKRLATAAVFMVVGTVVIAAFNVMSGYARQRAWQQGCMAQQSRIFDGLTQYTSDHDGRLPAVAAPADAPWWKVGDQGNENHSNTRALWLLVKLNYTGAADYVCPGASGGKVVKFDPSHRPEYQDFPSRQHITYSFRIRCPRDTDGRLVYQKVLMADLNPLFENLPDDYSESLRLRLTSDLLKLNSNNHRRRGQNVLSEDGRVQFVRTRQIGIFGDDIYTLHGRDVYHGTETPACASDFFLAP